MTAVLRSGPSPSRAGFYKALVAADSDRILGFTAFAPEAGEVMAIVQVAIAAGLPYTALRDAILTHPTMAEGLAALFRAVPAPALIQSAGSHTDTALGVASLTGHPHQYTAGNFGLSSLMWAVQSNIGLNLVDDPDKLAAMHVAYRLITAPETVNPAMVAYSPSICWHRPDVPSSNGGIMAPNAYRQLAPLWGVPRHGTILAGMPDPCERSRSPSSWSKLMTSCPDSDATNACSRRKLWFFWNPCTISITLTDDSV